jgi:hypothetical protein
MPSTLDTTAWESITRRLVANAETTFGTEFVANKSFSGVQESGIHKAEQ